MLRKGEKVKYCEECEEIEGQMEITDFKEVMP